MDAISAIDNEVSDATRNTNKDARVDWIRIYRQGQKDILCDIIDSLNEVLESDESDE